MKAKLNKFLVIILLFSSNTFYSQLVNPSFEEWETFPYLNPNGWTTFNFFTESVFQSSDAQHGSYSAKLEVVEYFGERLEPNLQNNGFGYYVDDRVSKIGFYYKSDFKHYTSLDVYVSTWDSNTTTQQLTPSGYGELVIRNSISNWTFAEVPINYYSTDDEPTYVSIVFAVTDSTDDDADMSALGSFAMIDNVSLDYVTSVEKLDEIPNEFALRQNYPNPFNPSTNIEYSISSPSLVKLKVYDILGNEVAELVNQNQTAGNYRYSFDGTGLSSGTYFVQLNTREYREVRKISLVK